MWCTLPSAGEIPRRQNGPHPRNPLLDSKKYTIPQLAERYRARWGVEEWYKVSKQRMEVEDFHGPSERGVKQKLYAGFPLNAMTRRFSGHGDHRWNESPHEHGKPRKQTHFKHGLAMVAVDIESLLLKQASALQETVTPVVRDIIRCRQRLRPGRSFERRFRKPVKKWQRGRRLQAKTTD